MSERRVTVYVREPSELELRTRESVQLDRVVRRDDEGVVHRRHGALLRAGANRVQLERGVYAFRALGDVDLRVVHGGVDVVTGPGAKDPWPAPPARDPQFPGDDAAWAAYCESQRAAGAGPAGPLPALTVEPRCSSEG